MCIRGRAHIYGRKEKERKGREGKGRKGNERDLSLIHISEPTRLLSISYAVFCLKKNGNHRKPHKNPPRQRQKRKRNKTHINERKEKERKGREEKGKKGKERD